MKHSLLSGILIWVFMGISWQGQSQAPMSIAPEKVQNYLRQYGWLARQVGQESGIPATIILAVAGLETGWGSSRSCIEANNHFGIKANPNKWSGPVFSDSTWEYLQDNWVLVQDNFRSYKTVTESYRDFARFLKSDNRYAILWQLAPTDWSGWFTYLQLCGYATDPDYSVKLGRMQREYQLQLLDY
ncbi:MAG: glucosaminidase domain-containing protein [Lewinellaceae bacterium]|nr:glucosaminidase domain-containing protein [Lewinellaceae bacterium]